QISLHTRPQWKCATTKYESVCCQLKGTTEMVIAVRPAHRNWKRKPQAKSIGVANRIRPPYIVATQLKILMPVGMAISMVDAANAEFSGAPIPTANMWWAQTVIDRKPMASDAATTIGQPKITVR